jgi:parvulin-like peptidyl-prolyl isomerase
VSAWAFGGARVGETSELFDDESGYYLARLDTLVQGGDPNFDAVKDEIRRRVSTEHALDKLMDTAKQVATGAAASSLEAAAQQHKLEVQHSGMFTRGSFVPGIGQFNEAIGAAFGLPVGSVGAPVRAADGIFVERLDKKVRADSAAWVAQKAQQRQLRLQQLQQQKVQMYYQDLRRSAKIDDRRKDINSTLRRAET